MSILAAAFRAAEVVTQKGEHAEEVGKPFHVPAAGDLFHFDPLFTVAGLEFTFATLVMFFLTAVVAVFFLRAFSQPKLVPTGSQNVAEVGVDFVRSQIVLPILGPHGTVWLPFLVAVFFWILLLNLMAIVPGVQFPITSRMAYPATLAIIVWFIYNAVGIKNQGFFGYIKNTLFPPGVPWWVYILLTPIEFISNFIVRPLTLAVRLFANMVAGHMILAVLFIATGVFFAGGALGKAAFVLPFALATILTFFELFVAGIQAFIFATLTAVYIASSQEAHH